MRRGMDIHTLRLVSPPNAGVLRLVNDGGALKILDPNGGLDTVQTTRMDDEAYRRPFAGEPANYAAPAPMTGTYTAASGKTLELTARVTGVLDPAPSLVLVDPEANDATVDMTEEDGVVTISLATGVAGAITTTLAQLKTLLDGSAFLSGIVGGTSTTVCIAGTTTLTGGSNAVPGTPARMGRIAIDGGDVWTAMADNATITQAGWVKTFTGGA